MVRHFVISVALVCLTLSATARTRPHYGGALRVEIEGDAWQMPDGLARKLVLDTLTREAEAGGALPALAVRWESQNADHRWEFWIRPGVRFQDGEALTSDAIATALQATCARPLSGMGACPWTAVHGVGPSLVFTSDSPLPDLPELLAQTEFAIGKKDATGAVIGTGPFRVTGYVNGALTLAANDDCWSGRPFVDVVELRTHRAIRDQWLDLSVGKTDVVEVPPEVLRQAQQQRLTVLESRPVDLLALTIAPEGWFASREMRQAVALAVDRAALYSVIFQKQGEVSASLLPPELSGYAFLFSPDRDLERARALRGGATTGVLTLGIDDPSATMELAAARLALNLHEAGFNLQVAPTGLRQTSVLVLRKVHLEATAPRAALDEMLAHLGQNGNVNGTSAGALWQEERAVLDSDMGVPLLWLPRAWAVGERVRDLRLLSDGTPDLSDASLEGAK